jgi:N-methylhydantoinase B
MNKGLEGEKYLGAVFSNIPIKNGDTFTRPSAGGGGYGDPITRPVEEVLEDVIDGYVSIARAATDYGVVISEIDPDLDQYEVDHGATNALRASISKNRISWLAEDPEAVAARYRAGELSDLDLIRQFGVIVDWGTGELFPETTRQFRDLVRKRAVAYWKAPV